MLDSVRLTLLLPHTQVDTQSWFHSVVYFPHIGSTNSELMQESQRRDTVGEIFLTQYQTQGRGRLGRVWMASPQEQLALSCAVSLADFPVPGLLPLAVGLAVQATIQTQGVHCVLKWPNDILLQYQEDLGKGVGILVEICHCPSRGENIAIIGMGINIALSAETKSQISAAYPAQGLADILGPEIIEDTEFIYNFFSQLIKSLAHELTILQQNPIDIVQRYNINCATVNRDITVHCDPRSALGVYAKEHDLMEIDSRAVETVSCIIPAQAKEIADNGELIIEVAQQQFSINTADIKHIRF